VTQAERGARLALVQEDLVRRRSAAARWTWSIARPHILCDEETPHPRSVALVIAVLAMIQHDKNRLWERIVARHGLQDVPLSRVALWEYGDYVFAPKWDIMSSMDKARRLGFAERVDTPEMFTRLFGAYRAQRIIP